ncbi:unnamed protein product [Parajaminaea phylloscopi]
MPRASSIYTLQHISVSCIFTASYNMLLVLVLALSIACHSAAAKNDVPHGEGDCITQKATCVIAYLDDMDEGQGIGSVRSAWRAGSGLGWAVAPGSTGSIGGSCQHELTKFIDGLHHEAR